MISLSLTGPQKLHCEFHSFCQIYPSPAGKTPHLPSSSSPAAFNLMGFTSLLACRITETGQSHLPLGTLFRTRAHLTLLLHRTSLPQPLVTRCGPTWCHLPLGREYLWLINQSDSCLQCRVLYVLAIWYCFEGQVPPLTEAINRKWSEHSQTSHSYLCLMWGLECGRVSSVLLSQRQQTQLLQGLSPRFDKLCFHFHCISIFCFSFWFSSLAHGLFRGKFHVFASFSHIFVTEV